MPPTLGTLSALVELTGVRWILVHGEAVSKFEYESWKAASHQNLGLDILEENDGHLLLAVRRRARLGWVAALRSPHVDPTRTVLGTPLAPLSSEHPSAEAVAAPDRRETEPGIEFKTNVVVRNSGRATWPALLSTADPPEHLVVIETQWTDAHGTPVGPVRLERLGRDIEPTGETRLTIGTHAPEKPGAYAFEIRLRQHGGATLASTRVDTEVEIPPAAD